MLARVALALVIIGSQGTVSLVGVYPNPAIDGDRGEYVLLHSSEPTALGGYALTDGEDTVALPDAIIDGTVAITDDPAAVNLTDTEAIVVDEGLSLSNGGESVRLTKQSVTVSELEYDRAPEAELYNNGSWTPLGATAFDSWRTADVPVTAFALPDAPSVPIDALRDADDRIFLAGYTLTSTRVVDILVKKQQSGVNVTVLADLSPVGGMPASAIPLFDTLAASGVEVRLSGGRRARYDFHHAKYAIVDNSVLVTSENWKPSGIGGNASRGWGVTLEDDRLATRLTRVFEADSNWGDAQHWNTVEIDGQPSTPSNDTFPTRFDPEQSVAEEVSLILAPDNAEKELVELIRGANDSIRIEQVSVDSDGPLLRETIAAARDGVEVKILLSGTWYVREENRALETRLERMAERDGLPLSVELAEPRSRYDHLHVKGVIVDDRHTVVGSINWNRHALRENREVAVVVTDDRIGRYYTRLFRADWRGAAWRLHWLTVGGLAVALLGAVVGGRKIQFDGGGGN